MEGKVSDFKNHRRFSLRCLDKGLIPVSVKLKNHIRTHKGRLIIEKAEKQLLNERIKSINYKLERFDHDRYMYRNELKDKIGQDQVIWEACLDEINKRREIRHNKVMNRQIKKYEILVKKREEQIQGGCSKHHSGSSKDKEDISLSKENQGKKWVINLSSVPLTKDQEDLLSHGPNFAITPKKPPLGDYITNIEKACQSLDVNSVEELRLEIYRVLRKTHHLKPNINRKELGALRQLRDDKSRMVLTADKGVALVVIDRTDYIRKAKELLQDTSTYRTIKGDSTNKLKNRLINILKKIKAETGMQDNIYKKMYPTGASPPKFYGLPKIHKKNIPLRPLVSSIGSVSYGVAKELSKIIKPLMGCSIHHVHNSTQFAEEIKKTKIQQGECITSYDVTALFTSIPVPSTLDIIRSKLEQDAELSNRTIMSADNIIELLGFCLSNTYFVFQEEFYEQTRGASMGSPKAQLWQTSLWRHLRRRPLKQLYTHLGYGRGM